MKKASYGLILLPALCLANHSPTSSVALLQAYLDKSPPLCLGLGSWPVLSSLDDSYWLLGRLEALVNVGLAKREQRGRHITFRLSQRGQHLWSVHQDFCYGRLAVSRIISVKNAGKSIIWRYRIENLADWSTYPDLRFAFSDMNNMIEGIDKHSYQAIVKIDAKGKPVIKDFPIPVQLDY